MDMDTDCDTEVSVQRTVACGDDLTRFQLIDKSNVNGVRTALFAVRINANGCNNICLSASDFGDERLPTDAINLTNIDIIASADFPFSITVKSLSQQEVCELDQKRCCKWSKIASAETFQSITRGNIDVVNKQIPCNVRLGRGGVLIFASDFLRAVQELKPNGGIWLEIHCTYTEGWKPETVTKSGKRVLDVDADFRSGFRFGKSSKEKPMKAAGSAKLKEANKMKKKNVKVTRSVSKKPKNKTTGKKATKKNVSKSGAKKPIKKSNKLNVRPTPPPSQWMSRYIQ